MMSMKFFISYFVESFKEKDEGATGESNFGMDEVIKFTVSYILD